MKTTLNLAFLATFAMACTGNGNGDPDPDGCALDEIARQVLTDTVRVEIANTSWTLDGAEARSMAWGLVLQESELMNVSVASLFFPCEAPASYDPYCSDDDQTGLLACSQYACEEANVHAATAWFADAAHDGSLVRHELSWDADLIGGQITASENPMITWHADVSGDPKIWAEASHAMTLGVDGTSYDTSYDFDVSAQHGAITSLDATITFPGLSEQGPVDAQLQGTDDTFAGQIALGETVLAEVTADGNRELQFTWLGACADAR